MVKKLKDQIEGKGFEELSENIRREGQGVTGAILEEAIKIRGARAAFGHHLHVSGMRADPASSPETTRA